jgi:hypothetical protein
MVVIVVCAVDFEISVSPVSDIQRTMSTALYYDIDVVVG